MPDKYNKEFSVEQIELDMWKRAREVWQVKDLPIESFDPLVKLLIGACAVEVKKLSDEIQSSRSRVLERLAQVMMPDVLTGPLPASTILQLHPTEPTTTVSPELQVSCAKDQIEFFFSPAGSYKIIDAKVEHTLLLLSDNLIDITEHTLPGKGTIQRKVVDSKDRQSMSMSNLRTLLIGLDINDRVASLEGISFFFDWKNVTHRKREEYCRLLQSTQWLVNGSRVAIHVGQEPASLPSEPVDTILAEEFDVGKVVEKRIRERYKHHFVTIDFKHQAQISSMKRICPDSLLHLFPGRETPFAKPLVWFEVYFPASFPNVALEEQLSHCLINCVPALNRRLNTKRYALIDQSINVVPLETDEQLFAVHEVSDSSANLYQNIQTLNQQDDETRTYYLRHGGITRIDSRRGLELIHQLQDVIKDESAAFAAINPDELLSDLNTLKQILARIDKNVKLTAADIESTWYVVLNQPKKENGIWEQITVKYWSTLGSRANDLAPGEINRIVSMDAGPAIKEAVNVAPSLGGRDRLRESEIVHAYRNEIMTRGRIVTVEDIKSVCFAYLGSQISDIQIEKGFAVDSSPANGLVRTLKVILTPSAACRLTGAEWAQMCMELQSILETNWTGNLPIVVRTLEQTIEDRS